MNSMSVIKMIFISLWKGYMVQQSYVQQKQNKDTGPYWQYLW